MLTALKSIDQSWFLFLNGLHSPFFDPVIFFCTRSLAWLPLYFLLLYLVIRKYKWQTLWVLLFATLMILVSDQLSNFFKDWVARLRPTHEPGLTGIHTVNGYLGGTYGFYSAHASTTMAIAVFVIILLKENHRYIIPMMILWALFMSYTRIYLGVHYPGDVLSGMLMGFLIGNVTARLSLLWLKRSDFS